MRATSVPRKRHAVALSSLFSALSISATLVGCGDNVSPMMSRDSSSQPDAASIDDVATMDGSTDDAPSPVDVPSTDVRTIQGHGAVLYLNFNGGASFTLEGPHAGNQVWVPAFAEAVGNADRAGAPIVPASALAEGWQARRASIIEATRANLANLVSPFDVRVVTDRPATRADIEILVGGDNTVFGRPGACTQRVGFAALVCGDLRPGEHRVGHTLGRCVGSGSNFGVYTGYLAKISAHEMGHSLSLEHVDNPESIMFFAGGFSGTWASGPISTGPSELESWRECRMGFQDTEGELRARLGTRVDRPAVVRHADATPPMITRVVPADGSVVPPGTRACLVASDNGEIEYVYVEAYRAIGSGELYSLIGEAGSGDVPYRFNYAAPSSGEVVYRFTVTDTGGNLTEVHSRVRIDPAAPAPMGCP